MRVNESLSLVIPQTDSAAEIFNLIDGDKDHLRTWLPWVDATATAEDTRENLAQRIAGFSKKKDASFYGTFDGDFVASVGFVSLSDGVGEIGYWLLSKYAGKGLMTTYVKACINYGFEKLNLQKIVIKCAAGNNKSAAIPKRLGFIQSESTETTRIRNGSEHHTLIFSLERENWSR